MKPFNYRNHARARAIAAKRTTEQKAAEQGVAVASAVRAIYALKKQQAEANPAPKCPRCGDWLVHDRCPRCERPAA